jgi:hypothetical protein
VHAIEISFPAKQREEEQMPKRILGLALAVALAGATNLLAAGGKVGTIHKVGTVNLQALSHPGGNRVAPDETGLETMEGPETNSSFQRFSSGAVNRSRVPASHVPSPPSVEPTFPGSFGFNGIRHKTQRLDVDGGNQFSLEPPDQGLAVGDCLADDCGGTQTTYVMDSVNLAIAVRDSSTGAVLAEAALNPIFAGDSAIIRGNPTVYGEFLSDPKCYYDPTIHRWFVTILEIDTNPLTGAFTGRSSVRIAVSQSSNPRGVYYIYSIDTTNDGTNSTPSHPNCPCFGDQPLIGADQYAFWFTTNEFPISGPGFNQAQVYAIDKAAMAAGGAAKFQLISPGGLEEGYSYTVQPATIPPGGAFDTSNDGTQYFLSALEFFGTLDNRIAIWAATNTSSITTTPAITLKYGIIQSEVYGPPPIAQQPLVTPGQFCNANPWSQEQVPLPFSFLLPTACELGLGGILFGPPVNVHEPLVKTNDDRMQQVLYANGRLWSTLTTVAKTKNGPTRTAGAYFIVNPSVDGSGMPSGTIHKQGYIAVNNTSVAFPTFGANSSGEGVIGMSLIGPNLLPSAAWVKVDDDPANPPGDVVIAGSNSDAEQTGFGLLPDDGFTGYFVYDDPRAARWGDYGGTATDSSGNVWTANEYVPILSRSVLANWGTFISKVAP